MPTGYKVNGVDLDQIFAPLLPENVPANAVGFTANGQNLSNLFDPITTNGQKIGSNTNLKDKGVDLRNFYCDINFTRTPTLSLSLTPTPTPSKSYR